MKIRTLFPLKIGCLSLSMRKHVQLHSLIDILVGVLLTILVVCAFSPVYDRIWGDDFDFGYLIPFICAVGVFVLQSTLAIFLFLGVHKSKESWCFHWILATSLLLMLKMITVTVHLVTENHDHDAISFSLIGDSLFKVYQIVTVILFLQCENEDHGKPALIYNKSDLEPV